MNIVIDTNRFMSALIKDGTTRKIIFNANDILLCPEFELEETLNHKKEILQKSGLSEDDFNFLFYKLLNQFKIIKIEQIIKYKEEADIIIKKNFQKNRLLHPKGWSLFGDFSLTWKFFRMLQNRKLYILLLNSKELGFRFWT